MVLFEQDLTNKDIVIIGWPTAGKTHLTNFLKGKTDHVFIHTDDYQERVGDFKQELYVLLDDIEKIDKPLIVEGILGYRLLRKGVELNRFHPDIVINLQTDYDHLVEVYKRERPGKDYVKAYNLAKASESILTNYKAMMNPSPPTWIEVHPGQTFYTITKGK